MPSSGVVRELLADPRNAESACAAELGVCLRHASRAARRSPSGLAVTPIAPLGSGVWPVGGHTSTLSPFLIWCERHRRPLMTALCRIAYSYARRAKSWRASRGSSITALCGSRTPGPGTLELGVLQDSWVCALPAACRQTRNQITVSLSPALMRERRCRRSTPSL